MTDFWDLYGVTLTFGGVYALFALSTHAALWSGLLSLASAACAAVSGYTVAAITAHQDLGVVATLMVGFVAGGLVALVVGLLLIRLDSHWFALGTVAMVLIVRELVVNVPSTGGTRGQLVLSDVTAVHVFGSVLVFGWVFARLRRSRLGLAAEAARRDPAVAVSLGIQVRRLRLSVLALSGSVAGVAGVLFAGLTSYLTPDTYYVDLAFVMLAGAVFGGAYYWLGAMVGGFLFAILPDLLQNFFGHGQQLVNGVLLLVVVLFLPDGVIDPHRIGALGRWTRERSRAKASDCHQRIAGEGGRG